MSTADLYRRLTTLAGPAIDLYLTARRAAGKEDRTRFAERRGRPGRPRPSGPLLWLHAASVGEAQSALALIRRLLAESPARHALVTTGTVTSARIMAARLPERAFHQYVPVDRARFVRRFLDHWRPDLALWMESELWPNLVIETAARGVPLVLVNARMSDRSFRGWQRLPGLARSLLCRFDLVLAQSGTDAERYASLGARTVAAVGNLKFAAEPLPADGSALAALESAVAGRPLWLAASTHPGEEAPAIEAHRRLAAAHPGLLTVIAPRHPTRGAEVVALCRGLAVARRSLGEIPDRTTDIYVADTIGEMGILYRLAGVVFVGGSLIPHGGQNPIEPAQLDCAIVHGPHMHNFRAIVAELDAAGASEEVADAGALAEAVGGLLGDPSRRAARARAAARVASAHRDVLDAVAERLAPYLPAAPRETTEVARARA